MPDYVVRLRDAGSQLLQFYRPVLTLDLKRSVVTIRTNMFDIRLGTPNAGLIARQDIPIT